MNVLIKALLLALTFILVFINPRYIGKTMYYSLFPLLFVLVWLLDLATNYISMKKAQSVIGKQILYSRMGSMIPFSNEGEITRGRLAVTEENLVFLKKTKKGCEQVWSLPTKVLTGFTLGKVLAMQRGITFSTAECEYKFSGLRFSKSKPEITKALGWDQKL